MNLINKVIMQSGNLYIKKKQFDIANLSSAQSFSINVLYFIAILSPFWTLFAPLSLAPLFIIGAIVPTVLVIKDRGIKFIFQSNIYLTAWVYLIFSAISSIWAVEPIETLNLTWRMALILIGAICMFEFVAALPHEKKYSMAKVLLVSFIVGIIAANIEIISGGLITKFVKSSKHVYKLTDLNRGSSYLSVIFWPCFAYLLLSGRKTYAGILFAITFITVLRLESQSAPLALGLAAAVFVLISLTGRRGISLIMVLTILVIPAVAITAKLMDPAKMFQTVPDIPNSASEYRLYIWNYAANKASEKPWLGWGFNAARSFPVAESEYVLGGRHPLPLHPHNNILQVWLETGIVGVVIFAAFLLFLMQRVKDIGVESGKGKDLGMALFMGLIVNYFIIGAIGYGIWQNWWVSAIFISSWFMLSVCEE
jgi:O-antigen ligase